MLETYPAAVHDARRPFFILWIWQAWSTVETSEQVRSIAGPPPGLRPTLLRPLGLRARSRHLLRREQHDSRFRYTTVLRNIPFRLDGMDLINILQDSGAASLGLPRNRVSYGNKPWCYFFFKSQEALDSAIEMNFTLKNQDSICGDICGYNYSITFTG